MNNNNRKNRTKITFAAAVALLAFAALAPYAIAGSLWSDSAENLLADGKAHYVDDVVTIIVNESTSANNTSSTNVNQEEKMDVSDGTGILNMFFNAFGIQSKDEYKTDGTTTSGGTLRTTIQATVVEVMPNGNLVIEARRSMVVNQETQTMVLSGVIRPRDITGDNTVLSSKIANAQIKYTGKGPIARRQHTGILNKLFDWIF